MTLLELLNIRKMEGSSICAMLINLNDIHYSTSGPIDKLQSIAWSKINKLMRNMGEFI